MHRRQFLSALTATAASYGLPQIQSLANAQSTSDYKALVCVFLFGGNDGNNMIVPVDNAGYSQYASIRSVATGINLAQSDLLPISTANVFDRYGLHPAMTGLHSIFEQGKAATLANVGTLLAPLTRTQYRSGLARPDSLFSHNDQQNQWQNLSSSTVSNIGWGGRMGDVIYPMNAGAATPVVTSLAGSSIFIASQQQSPLTLPVSGTFGLTGFGTDAASVARLNAYKQLLKVDKGNELVKYMAEETDQAITLSSTINPILTNASSPMQNFFGASGNSLASQLLQVAKLIEARNTLGVKRQVFFVSLGGFDNHTNQLASQDTLLGLVSAAMTSFYNATVQLGIANQVTQFTMSDFGRTFKPAAGGGSDHAWGNHHIMVGGAVNGGRLYGTFPTHILGTGDDGESEGRWIPTTSVDQYAATLAKWFGVADADLVKVCPNLNAFANKNLGFMA